MVNSAAPPVWVRGQSGGPCKENSCWAPGDTRVSRRSSGATEARRGSRGDFSLSLESESDSNFVLIAVFVVFLSVLEKGLRPQVLAINVSKFLPASIAVKDN